MADEGYRNYYDRVAGSRMSQSQDAVPSVGMMAPAGESRASKLAGMSRYTSGTPQQIPSRQGTPQTTQWSWSAAFDNARRIVGDIYGSARNWTSRTFGWNTPRYTIPSNYIGDNRRFIQQELGPQYAQNDVETGVETEEEY